MTDHNRGELDAESVETCKADNEDWPCDAHQLGVALEALQQKFAGERHLFGPPGTRLILASDDLLEQWVTRDDRGVRITAEWGEQRPEGWYEPVFTVHDGGEVLVTAESLAAALCHLAHITGYVWCRRHMNEAEAILAAIKEPQP